MIFLIGDGSAHDVIQAFAFHPLSQNNSIPSELGMDELSHISSQRVELFIVEFAPATFEHPSSSDRIILAAKVGYHLRRPIFISLIKMSHEWDNSAVEVFNPTDILLRFQMIIVNADLFRFQIHQEFKLRHR